MCAWERTGFHPRNLQNIAIILTLLLLPYWVLMPAHVSEPFRGRIGVALVFVFTSVGHLIKTAAMAEMLPGWVPMRVPLIYITRIVEFLGAAAILIPTLSRYAGLGLGIFLL